MNEQLHFILAITSGAIPTEFSVSRMRGREAISELFHFEVDIAEPELGWPEDIAPGGRAELRWVYEGQVKRTVYGMFAHVEKRVWGNGEKTAFRVHLVPRAHRLAMVKTQQIFMEMGLEDIARRKTKLLGLSDRDVGWNVLGEDPAREFIVQYQESDLDVSARHAEHRGIAYYFDHEDDYDRLVFTDHNGGFFTNEALPTVAMGENAEDHNQVYELRRDEKMIPRVYVVYDYNYRTPSVNIKAQETLNPSEGGGVVEYGVHAKTGGEAQALAKIRAEELSCRKAVYRGESGVVEIAAGLKTTMEAYDHGEALPLLIITVEHEFDLAAEGATG
ncbi:MAG: phage late control D family protein, partial [Myxococcota bacterium]